MNDPLCIICTPGLCVHGEQSVTPEELEIDRLKGRIDALLKNWNAEVAERNRRVSDLEACCSRLQAQIQEAAAVEREACAKVADEVAAYHANARTGCESPLRNVAAAIRARGGT